MKALDLMIAATLFFMIGCVGEEEALLANFVSSNPPDGDEIAVNRTLTIIFDNPPQEVTVNGQPTTVKGKTATWRAMGLNPGQPATIQIAWKDGSKTITLNVKAEEETPEKEEIVAAVPIPELRLWEENMKIYGMKHGDDSRHRISADYTSEAHVWYYDGARVFYQITDYTNDPKWNQFAENCMETYRGYVFELNGKVPGWRIFPHGLYMHFKRTGDEKSKEAAILLSKNAKYAPVGGDPGEEQSRETAYCINAYLVAEAIGEPRHPKLKQAVEYALGHIEQWFVQNVSRNWAPFMFGLTCEALIAYHDKVNKDPRILPAIKMGLDECWKRAWIEEKQAFFYRADNPTNAAPGLNLLVAPAFAWVYLQTGDIKYRDRGDRVFAGGVCGAWLDGGKQFSQNYRWSFDYIKWRTEVEFRRIGR
jgi:hypothetical protein